METTAAGGFCGCGFDDHDFLIPGEERRGQLASTILSGVDSADSNLLQQPLSRW